MAALRQKRRAKTKEEKQAGMRERMRSGESRNGKHGRYKRTLAQAWEEIERCAWMIGYDGPSPTPQSAWPVIEERARLFGLW